MNRTALLPPPLAVAFLAVAAVPGVSAQKPPAPKPKPAAAKPPPPTSPVAAARRDPNGYWEGKLTVNGGITLTLGFRVSGSGADRKATLDVPEQDAKNVPVKKTTIRGDAIAFEMPEIRAVFKGTLSPDGGKIVGTFTQQGASLPLTLARKAVATTFNRPQTPKPPFPYKTEDVSYPNPNAEGVTLAGTLTLPPGDGPFPVAVFISGSGPQDRDEAILGHRPFAVLADHLARRGVASLRYDDRGFAKSTGRFEPATSADFATDVRAGVAYLKTRKEVEAKKIGLVGHSEGGLIAPLVAADNQDIAFIVLLAGTGVAGADILLAQQELIARANGSPKKDIEDTRRVSTKAFALLRTETDPAKAEVALGKLLDAEIARLPKAEQAKARKEKPLSMKVLMTPWMRYFIAYDPAPALRKVRCPVLALNGEKDLQVPPKQNLPAIEAAVKAGGNSDVTTRELPGLNHLFQTSKTGSPAEYAGIEETFAPDALKLVGDWILSKTRR